MYAAALLFMWAGVASHASPWPLAVGIVITAIVVARVVAEEGLLRAKYPDYQAYAKTTSALVPFVF
jgi:protein-S-isoprenylcysteine O-methyltransferase Ste14